MEGIIINNVSLLGRLTNDVDTRYTQATNTIVVQFTLAVNRPYAKETDEQKADFITIVAWNKTAEFCNKYFKKGMQIALTGRIETGSYDDKDGKKVYTTKIVAEHVYFADSKKDGQANEQFTTQENEFKPVESDSLPFYF